MAHLALRLRSAERADGEWGPGAQMELYAEAIHSGSRGLVELIGAHRAPDGSLRMLSRHDPSRYLLAGDRRALRAGGGKLAASGAEVFITPATLGVAEPGNSSVIEASVVWVDLDTPEGVERLRAFPHPPHLVVWSGGGGAHAYWRLADPVGGAEVEAANRKLAAALGADRQSTNRGRIMRLPGTHNQKPGAGECAVAACDLALGRYRLDQLCSGLSDPRSRNRSPERPRPPVGGALGSELDLVPPPAYFAALLGEEVSERGELISCPSATHTDRRPSCMVYPDPGAGWSCFSCGAAGNAPDLVSAIGGGPTGAALRGGAFLEARREAERALGLTTNTDPHQEVAR